MAITRTLSGSVTLDLQFLQQLSGDAQGGESTPVLKSIETWYDDAGSTDPKLAGWFYGAFNIAAGGDILLAHATDPLQGFGASVASDGLVASGKKLKLLYLKNTHATAAFQVVQKTANGLLLFDKVTGQTIGPGGKYLWEDPTGGVLGAVVTGTSDGITLALPGAASSAVLFTVWGT